MNTKTTGTSRHLSLAITDITCSISHNATSLSCERSQVQSFPLKAGFRVTFLSLNPEPLNY